MPGSAKLKKMDDYGAQVINTEKEFNTLADLITLGSKSLEGIFATLSNGVTITDAQSRVIYVNPAFTRITGYEANEIIGGNPGMLHSGMHDNAFYQQMWHDISHLGRWQGEIWNRRKNGLIIPELLTITKIVNEQQQIFYIGIFSDISNLVHESRKKLNMALHDPLTHLCNRSLLKDRFEMALNNYRRNYFCSKTKKEQLALLFMDLNLFKQINDTYGHIIGDQVLIHVADLLKKNSRGIDTVARYGGDEFVVLLPVKTKKDVDNYCERLLKELNIGLKVNELFLLPRLSIGVSFFSFGSSNFETLLAQADRAMYYGKRHERYVTYFSKHLPP